MNVKIITHHNVFNHGALLQLYALRKVLQTYDESVCALDFKKNMDFLGSDAEIKYNITLKSIPYYLKYLVKKGLVKTLFNVKKKRQLDKFRETNSMVGDYYYKYDDLDYVFIGSDEIFSIEPGLNPCFWGMGVKAKHVISYAASFGPTNLEFIENHYATEFVKAGIERIEKIGVRDKNSYDIITKLSDKKVEMCCDPVILYGYKNEIASFKRPLSYKYILVYAYDNNMNDEKEVNDIRKLAKEKGLKIISVGFFHKWCDKCINVDPINLLKYIKFSEFVITDTFHGTVMSLITETQFITKLRGNANKLKFLLSEYKLENRITEDFKDLNKILESPIDYNEVNKEINSNREKGLEFIKNCFIEEK